MSLPRVNIFTNTCTELQSNLQVIDYEISYNYNILQHVYFSNCGLETQTVIKCCLI